jgi:DNA-binding PadR family transcriptional regulator
MPLSTTEAAVLGLLALNGERSGYDLLKQAERSVGHVWSPTKSHLYATLPRLVGAGLATRREVEQRDRPDKQVYRLTETGEHALREWLETVDPGSDDTQIRIFLGVLVSENAVAAQVRRCREDALERLELFERIDETNTRSGADRFHEYVLRLGFARARATVAWADEILAELDASG